MIRKIGIYEDSRKKLPWVVRWYGVPDITTGKKKRYCKSFKTKQEAERFQAEQFLAFDDGEPRDKAEGITLAQFCSDWLKTKRNSIRAITYRDYERVVKRLCAYFGHDKPLRKISLYSATQFYTELQRQGQAGGEISDWTRNKILRYCRAMFAEAVERDCIKSNPFKKIKACRVHTRPWHYLDAEQYEKLLDAAPGPRWKALYSMAYTMGLRFGELFNLRWADVDFERRIVKIRNHDATKITPPFVTKNGRERAVPLPNCTKEILQRWQVQQGLQPYVLLTKRQYENMVARWQRYSREKRPWESQGIVNNLMREFRRHIKNAGIEPTATLTLHTLRKCAGKNWTDRLSNPRVVQYLLGHASLSTTMAFYNQVNQEDMKKAASAIDSLLSKTDAKQTPDAASA